MLLCNEEAMPFSWALKHVYLTKSGGRGKSAQCPLLRRRTPWPAHIRQSVHLSASSEQPSKCRAS